MIPRMSIRAVIFDRDNTLVRFDHIAGAAIEARIAAIAPALPKHAVAAHWQTWRGPWPRTVEDEPAFWRLFWSDLVRRNMLHGDVAAALQGIGECYYTCFAAFPDTRDCIETLRAHGLRLAVLTNFELPSIHLTLRHAGLEPAWFDAMLSSVAIGAPKPDPRAYIAAAAALNLRPAECAFVDDLPENVDAAGAVGMQAWLIDRECSYPSSAPTINNLRDLAVLLTHDSKQPT
jgi:putative hydrolase of the HAD superfamily